MESHVAVDSLKFDDPRVERLTAQIRGKTYSYILGKPTGTTIAHVVLVHGFPDLGWGWRYQVPYLMSKGLSVVVPDMLGYGGSDAPEELEAYSFKSVSDDLVALVAHVWGAETKIILGGHDWGGAVIWRFALWHPELLLGVFSVCTPYWPPTTQYYDLAAVIAAGKFTHFGYQLQFRGTEAETAIQGEDKIRQFLNAMLAGRTPEGDPGFSPQKGALLDVLPRIGPSPLVPADEVEVYVREYSRKGMRGPFNWYRTRKINFDEELPLAQAPPVQFSFPAMYVAAKKDVVLLPSMADGMEKFFTGKYLRREVDSGHWALTVTPKETNEHIGEFVDVVLAGINGQTKASL